MKKQLSILILFFMAMTAIIKIPDASADLSDGLMAYYPFDGTAEDLSGNNNDGIEEGGVVYKMGVKGESAGFDGVDDYIRVAADPTLNPVDQLTISFWVKVEGYTNQWSALVHKGGPVSSGCGNREYTVWLQDTSLFHTTSAGDNSGQHYQNAGCAGSDWTHYVGIIDRQNHRMRIYVDGVLKVDGGDSYSTFNNNDRDLLIGWTEETSTACSPFKGRIDELRIYDRVLGEEEIKTLYDEISPYSTIYFNDFNEAAGAEWSSPSLSITPVGARKFLGVFANNNVQLNLSGYPEGEVTVNFDLFILSSWDGNNTSYGPDYFMIRGDGQSLMSTTFNNIGNGSQSYPGNYRSNFPRRYGAVESNTLGYNSYYGDTIYSITRTFHHISGNIFLNFIGTHLEGWNNEGWGLDNVRVNFQPNDPYQSGSMGNNIKVPSTYEFSMERNVQDNVTVQLTNQSEESQSVTIDVVNPHTELTVTINESNPLEVAADAVQDIPVIVNTNATPIGVYDNLLLKVTTASGETLYSNLIVTVTEPGQAELPDLSVKAADIKLADYTLGESASLEAVIHNTGSSPAADVRVRFYEFGTLLGETVLAEVAAKGTATAAITAPITTSGEHLIRVVVDEDEMVTELCEWNNEAAQIVKLGTPPPVPGRLLVTGSLPSTVYTNEMFTISGKAAYDVYVDGVRYTNYVVKGGTVQITISDDNGNEWLYGNIHTDINGRFRKTVQAPAPSGDYHIAMTVSDGTLSGERSLLFSTTERPPVPPAPPLPPISYNPGNSGYWSYNLVSGSWTWTWSAPPGNTPRPETDLRVFSENIHFSAFNPAPGDETTIFAEINYWATSTDLVTQDVPINFYATYPGTPKMKIGETVIDYLSVGGPDFGSRYVYTSWKNSNEGIHLIEVEIDPAYVEENMLNNAATRAIIVGGLQSFQGAIAGQVTDAWGGVEGVMIELYDATGTTLLENQQTDATGSYLFVALPVAGYQVRVVPPAEHRADQEIKPAQVLDQQVTEVDFKLSRLELPVADAGGPYVEMVGNPVTLDASGSHDPDGDIVLFEWDCDNDGTYELSFSTPTVEHIWGSAFSGTIHLRVTDNDGLTATATAEAMIDEPAVDLCGDLDHDGDVDGDDRNILRYALNTTTDDAGFVAEADYDGDGLISYNDYREWYACYQAFIAQ